MRSFRALFVSAVALSALLFTATPAEAETAAPAPVVRSVAIASGGMGGIYFPTAGAICLSINRSHGQHGVLCNVQPSVGSVFNARQVNAGRVEMGIVQSDVLNHAWNGAAPFPAKLDRLRSVVTLFAEPVTLVTRRASGIKTVADLRGKRVNLGEKGSGQERTAMDILRVCGVGIDTLASAQRLQPASAVSAIATNELDAFFSVIGHPNERIWQLSEQSDIAIVPLGPACRQAMLKANPYYVQATVPAGMYRGVTTDVPTIGVQATLVTHVDIPEETIAAVTGQIVEKLYRFRRLHPDFDAPDPRSLFSGVVIPVHPGVFRYFKEKGVMEKSHFFDPGAHSIHLTLLRGMTGAKAEGIRLSASSPMWLTRIPVEVGAADDLEAGLTVRAMTVPAAEAGGPIHWIVRPD